jgi:hypothetical protein
MVVCAWICLVQTKNIEQVLWIGFVFMPVRIRISKLMPIQIEIRMPDWHKNYADPHADPSPALRVVKNQNFFLL